MRRTPRFSTRRAPGQSLRVHLEIENVGFAPPYDARRAQLSLRSASGEVVLLGAPVEVDVTSYLPGMHTMELAATVPAATSAGTWELRLSLLEDASDAPAYAMLLANDARVRDDVRRENVLGTIAVTP